jgi:hypothetical protein
MITRDETGFSQPCDYYRHHQTSIKLHLGSLFGKKWAKVQTSKYIVVLSYLARFRQKLKLKIKYL